MKRYCKNVDITNIDFIESCILKCLTGKKKKWNRIDTICTLSEFSGLPKSEIRKNIKECNYLKLEEPIRRVSEYMSKCIINNEYNFQPIKYSERFDVCSQKWRTIGSEHILQQFFDYVAITALTDLLSKKIGMYQCASIPNRGQVYGKKALERWIRTDSDNCRYAEQLDIKKCYQSINTELLMKRLRRDVKNEPLLNLVSALLSTYCSGLAIGSYLSQWLCNYYLSYAYHYANEQLYKIRKTKHGDIRTRLISHVLFYMDDFILLGTSAKDVKKATKMMILFIKNELGLNVKPKYKEFTIDYIGKDGKHYGSPIDMMGYIVYRKHTAIRRSIFKKIRRSFLRGRKHVNKNLPIPLPLAYKIISYNGWITNSSSNRFKKKYKADIVLSCAKKSVSRKKKGGNTK